MLTASASRWAVCWVVVKKKKGKSRKVLIEKDFEDDLTSAMSLYIKAKEAGKPFATLVCRNVGWAPPMKYRPYDKVVAVKKTVRGRFKTVRTTVHVVPMEQVNLQAVWWCPYCREFRRFLKVSGFESEGIWVPRPIIQCPICGAHHTNHHVRKWNPDAAKTPEDLRQRRMRRQDGGKSSRRRARSK